MFGQSVDLQGVRADRGTLSRRLREVDRWPVESPSNQARTIRVYDTERLVTPDLGWRVNLPRSRLCRFDTLGVRLRQSGSTWNCVNCGGLWWIVVDCVTESLADRTRIRDRYPSPCRP